MEQNKGYVIFDQQTAGLLMFFKHRLKKSRPDNKDLTKNVFIFENTQEFLKDLDYIKMNKEHIYNVLNK